MHIISSNNLSSNWHQNSSYCWSLTWTLFKVQNDAIKSKVLVVAWHKINIIHFYNKNRPRSSSVSQLVPVPGISSLFGWWFVGHMDVGAKLHRDKQKKQFTSGVVSALCSGWFLMCQAAAKIVLLCWCLWWHGCRKNSNGRWHISLSTWTFAWVCMWEAILPTGECKLTTSTVSPLQFTLSHLFWSVLRTVFFFVFFFTAV